MTTPGEEIKAHVKRKQAADSSDEGEPSEDNKGGYKRRGAEKSADKGGETGKGMKCFVGRCGFGGDHRWTACHAVGPIGQKEHCTHCRKSLDGPSCPPQ